MKPFPRFFLAASLLGLALAPVRAGEPENPAATPTLRNDWLDRSRTYDAIAKRGDTDLLFVGDSITQGWNGNGKEVWAARYKPLKAANFGISGDRTEHVLWRLQNGNLEGIRPKVVVLLIGTNNLPKNNAAQTTEGVTAIVNELRARLPESRILVLGVFPRGGDPTTPWAARKPIAEINANLAKLADDKRVFFLDFGERFLTPGGGVSKELMYDSLHLTAKGYEVWAEAMQPALDALLK